MLDSLTYSELPASSRVDAVMFAYLKLDTRAFVSSARNQSGSFYDGDRR